MSKTYYIYMSDQEVYLLAIREDNIPANKIAAKVTLTGDKIEHLKNISWKEYQSLLEHYYGTGQKLVTA